MAKHEAQRQEFAEIDQILRGIKDHHVITIILRRDAEPLVCGIILMMLGERIVTAPEMTRMKVKRKEECDSDTPWDENEVFRTLEFTPGMWWNARRFRDNMVSAIEHVTVRERLTVTAQVA